MMSSINVRVAAASAAPTSATESSLSSDPLPSMASSSTSAARSSWCSFLSLRTFALDFLVFDLNVSGKRSHSTSAPSLSTSKSKYLGHKHAGCLACSTTTGNFSTKVARYDRVCELRMARASSTPTMMRRRCERICRIEKNPTKERSRARPGPEKR